MFTTWLQFSSFLNGNLIGGFDANFQLTDPGETLSSTSRSTHLQDHKLIYQLRNWYNYTITQDVTKIVLLPIANIFKNIIHVWLDPKAVDPHSEGPFFSGY